MNIKFQTVKITESNTFFEMKMGNQLVAMIKTEKNNKPLSFRSFFRNKEDYFYEEWQLMRILQFAGVENNKPEVIEGKDIKVVLNCDDGKEHVVGFGSTTKDDFFLIEYQGTRDFTQAEIEKLAREDSEYLKRFVI